MEESKAKLLLSDCPNANSSERLDIITKLIDLVNQVPFMQQKLKENEIQAQQIITLEQQNQ